VRKVNSTDFFNALETCGLHIIKEDGTLISRFIDKDGSNMLDFEDFLSSYKFSEIKLHLKQFLCAIQEFAKLVSIAKLNFCSSGIPNETGIVK
jgi:hypothetical protein